LLIDSLHRQTQGCTPADALTLVLDRTGYRVWTAAGPGGQRRLASVDLLAGLLAASGAPDLGTWLTDLHLGDALGPSPDRAGSVTVSTIHRSKGAEWPVVFVVGAEDGLLPVGTGAGNAARGDEDERRLAYVAVSRPQVLLYLTYCRTRRLLRDGELGPPERRRPSRYLSTLPSALLEPVA
jgi:superfamily I DNA/RNA helicase